MTAKPHYDWLWPHVKHQKLRRVIDCGAHKGYWTLYWHDKVDVVEAFEPNRDILPEFKHNTGHLGNVNLYEHCLGDSEGTVDMQYDTHPGTYHITKAPEGPYAIKTLDSYKFDDVDIIKIDVEGFEVPLLDGAKHTILYNKPWIQIESNQTGERFFNRPKRLINHKLKSFGMHRVDKEWPDQIWRF